MRAFSKRLLLLVVVMIGMLLSCEKQNSTWEAARVSDGKPGHLRQTKTFSADVAIHWMDMQVKQMRAYPGIIGNVAYSRQYAYCGIALYESVVPGMPAYRSIASQLNGLTGLPETKPGYAYHWAASANAALAYMNRQMFPSATAENKALMDKLEADLLTKYTSEADAATIERSVAFGRSVAETVFAWSETDGYKDVNKPYTPPVGFVGGQYWTPPSNPLPVHTLPYMGNLRRLVPESGEGAALAGPDYSQLPAMTLDVIQSKPAAGTDQYKMAFWWRDFPGTSTPGHYVSILRQVLSKEKPSLDVAAYAYALGGITVMDIAITTWQDKFKFLLARPFNYDDVIGQPFTPWLSAPHPEYPAAHASLSIANAEALTTVLGEVSFTDSTFYGLLTPQGITLEPRHYSSFRQAGEEAGWSRLYGGIHYRKSIEDGFWQGKKVAENVKTQLKFRD
ncbi:MAG TPA: vanadium-dependent haloperoxidase [Chitinophagaceae bacterium]|nr:vanadium-dependent haloperoxidase [Chitinophagaceae bacterium]